jgi:DNA-binding NarL/FixJ family response regulator
MTQLRIMIADDHDIVRQGFRSLLEGRNEWQVVAEASSGRQTLNQAKNLKPNIVILDIGLPELNGIDLTRQISRLLPKTQVLIVTMHDEEDLIRQALDSGARGFMLKTEAARHLVSAIEALAEGKPFFAPSVSQVVLQGYLDGNTARSRNHSFSLTSREREVVQMLAEGKSNKEIASELGISVRTAECHRTNIMRKLDMHSVSSLIRYAIRNKIVEA